MKHSRVISLPFHPKTQIRYFYQYLPWSPAFASILRNTLFRSTRLRTSRSYVGSGLAHSYIISTVCQTSQNSVGPVIVVRVNFDYTRDFEREQSYRKLFTGPRVNIFWGAIRVLSVRHSSSHAYHSHWIRWGNRSVQLLGFAEWFLTSMAPPFTWKISKISICDRYFPNQFLFSDF